MISVIVCTHNRAEQLARTLHKLNIVASPTFVSEILVVNNASTDNTESVIALSQKESRLPIRVQYEPNLGLNNARNTGVRHATGEIVAFIDDDVDILPGWAEGVVEEFSDKNTMAAGGSISPEWEGGAPPEWFHERLAPFFALLPSQKGDFFQFPRHPFGANMFFKRELLLRVGGFLPELDRKGETTLLSGGDTEIFHRIRSHGVKIRFAHKAPVVHRIASYRMTKGWILKRCYWQGVTKAHLERSSKNILQISLETLKRVLIVVSGPLITLLCKVLLLERTALVVEAGTESAHGFFRCLFSKDLDTFLKKRS